MSLILSITWINLWISSNQTFQFEISKSPCLL